MDWTAVPENWATELRLREVRNNHLKELLQLGRSVSYRSSGWSLWPRVCSNDLCTYEAVRDESDVVEDDIVFCQVQPHDRFFTHRVKRMEWHSDTS